MPSPPPPPPRNAPLFPAVVAAVTVGGAAAAGWFYAGVATGTIGMCASASESWMLTWWLLVMAVPFLTLTVFLAVYASTKRRAARRP